MSTYAKDLPTVRVYVFQPTIYRSPGVKANVVPVSKMIQVAKDTRFGNTKALLLFETPQDALAAIKGGVDIKELNIGSMAHSVGKVAVSKVLSLDEKDIETFVLIQ